MGGRTEKKSLEAYLYMLPALVMISVFIVVPIGASIYIMFTDYSVVGETHFVGYNNFIRAFRDKAFWTSLRNSLLFIVVVPVTQILALILAFLCARRRRGTLFFRTIFFVPSICSQVAIAIIWGNLIRNGVMDRIFMHLHLISRPLMLLSNKGTAILCLMLITIWQTVGFYMMIYLSGISNIPREIEDAARIDGADERQIIRYIFVPELKPLVWASTLNNIIDAVGIFDIVYILTQGGPNDTTLVINYYSYRKAFEDFQFGYAASIGTVQAIFIYLLMLGILVVYLRRKNMA